MGESGGHEPSAPRDDPDALFRPEAVRAGSQIGTSLLKVPRRVWPRLRHSGSSAGVGGRRRTPGWRRLEYVPQVSAAGCGAACLEMAAAFHLGPQARVRDSTSMVSARDLITAGAALGLSGRAVRADLHELRYLPLASIVHWNFNHYVVFAGTTRRGVRIIDPSKGEAVVSFEEFSAQFTGVAIVFAPSSLPVARPDGERAAETSPTVATVRSALLRGRRKGVVAALVLLTVAAQVLAYLMPLYVRTIIDGLDTPAATLRQLRGPIALICLSVGILAVVRGLLTAYLQTTVDHDVATTVFRRLLDWPFARFQARTHGDILHRIRSLAATRQMITDIGLAVTLDGGFALVYLIGIAVVDRQIAAVVALLAITQGAVLIAAWRSLYVRGRAVLDAQSTTHGSVLSTLAGIETIKGTNAEDLAHQHLTGLVADELNQELLRSRLAAVVTAVLTTFRVAFPLIVLYLSAGRVGGSELTLGALVQTMALAVTFFGSTATVFSSVLQVAVVRTLLRRVDDIFEADETGEAARPAPTPRRPAVRRVRHVGVTFHDVAFVPDGGRTPLFTDLSFSTMPRESLAIVGPSGVGKTTLIRLMLGLHQPTKGTVCAFAGRRQRPLDHAALRAATGLVTQEPWVFRGTLRDNLTMRKTGCSQDQLEEAVAAAGISELVQSLPLGYDTVIGDGGRPLSGGERQRVAIARALINRPALLVLDEPTRSLDPALEAEVTRRLLEPRSSTVAIVTHRWDLAQMCDRVLVLSKGGMSFYGDPSAYVGLPAAGLAGA